MSPAESERASEPVVVYLAGSGRSGSTMLERILGGLDGYVNVGEILDLPRRVAVDDELCGCGEVFSRCPFWIEVGDRLGRTPDSAWAAPGWQPGDLHRLHRLQVMLARQRHLPKLLTGRGSPGGPIAEYGARYRELFAAVAATAGADRVVDASKWPSQALALYRGGVDVRVIHLVRDVRGVANSLSKTDIARPQAAGGTGAATTMYSNPVALGAARWLATQTEVDLLRTAGVPVARMRYADLVTTPEPVLRAALRRLGCPVPAFSHIDAAPDSAPIVHLQASHGLSGNPSRFTHGPVALRPDDGWRRRLSPTQQRVAVAVALPQVLRDRVGGGAR